jgi:ComF family protein
VCEACWAGVRASAGIRLRFDAADTISSAAAVDVYDGRLRDIVHALKYDRRRSISPRLGALMRERGAEVLRGADGAVPVPLHPIREYQRGFNQAHDLAIHLGIPVLPLLKRIVHTHSQIDLPKHERVLNVRGAFAWNAPQRHPDDGPSAPPVVVLIDDVATTGATLEQCALVLKRSGVGEVRALTAARVVSVPR